MEASELRRALKILTHRMNDLHGDRAAKFRVPGQGPDPTRRDGVDKLLDLESRTLQRDSPSIGLEQVKR